MKVFVDTSAFLALINADDSFHAQASTLFSRLLTSGALLYTSITNYVIVETIAVLQNRHGLEPAYDFIDNILPVINIEWITRDEHLQGESLLRATNRRRVSLVDCVSFVIMNKLNIQHALAVDIDFEDFGFTLLNSI